MGFQLHIAVVNSAASPAVMVRPQWWSSTCPTVKSSNCLPFRTVGKLRGSNSLTSGHPIRPDWGGDARSQPVGRVDAAAAGADRGRRGVAVDGPTLDRVAAP